MSLPPGIFTRTPALGVQEITITSTHPTWSARAHRGLRRGGGVAVGAVVGGMLLWLWVALAESHGLFTEDILLSIVAMGGALWAGWHMWQGWVEALEVSFGGAPTTQQQRRQLWLDSHNLHLEDPQPRRIPYADIALVTDEAELLLADGALLALAPRALPETQRWLAGAVRAALRRHPRGTTEDVPQALHAVSATVR